jgi:hypothetical protein
MTSSEISDPAEIEEVDQFGSDLEFSRHDSMQWYLCSYAACNDPEKFPLLELFVPFTFRVFVTLCIIMHQITFACFVNLKLFGIKSIF